MSDHRCQPPVARRSFLVRLSAAAAALGVGAAPALAQAPARVQTAAPAAAPDPHWQPARYAQDDWLDQVPGKHRLFFDSITIDGLKEGLLFASNYFRASKNGYGLEDADLAVIVGLRHHSTPFAFNDAMWAKYGDAWGERLEFNDPSTGKHPVVNIYTSQLTDLAKHGAHYAICDMASHAYAGLAASKVGGDNDAIYRELRANAIGTPHFVPAGIVGVNRAQERAYSIVHAG